MASGGRERTEKLMARGGDSMIEAKESASPPSPVRFPIADALSTYPALHRALGPKWIAKEEATHPAESRCSLARWLRIDGYEVRPRALDRLLGAFEDRAGMAERRNRLKGDPLSLGSTMVELHFAGWLEANGFPFELPKVGPDFKVGLAEDSYLPIEVTTPRQDVWFSDLFDRLMYIKRESGLSLRFGFYRKDLPNDSFDVNRLDLALTEEIVMEVVGEALSNLAPAAGPSRPEYPTLVQRRPEIGLRATWWNDGTQYMSGDSGPSTGHPWSIWERIRIAACQKAEKQLPPDRPYALLVGADQINFMDRGNWAEWVKGQPDEHIPIRWADIPPQIKYVIFYKVSWGEIEPNCAFLLVNDETPFPNVVGFEEFRKRLFPIAYRKIPSRLSVWASTERCNDRRWL